MPHENSRDHGIVEAALAMINGEVLRQAFLAFFANHNISSEPLEGWEMPPGILSSEREYNRMSGTHISGSACNGKYWLYLPGLASRRSCGFGLKLSVLEISIHEMVHLLTPKRRLAGRYEDKEGGTYATREISGFSEYFMLESNEAVIPRGRLLTEGATQSIALEVLAEYLCRIDEKVYGGEKACLAHLFRTQEVGLKGAVYPVPVQFIHALAKKLASEIGSEKRALSRIYRALLESRLLTEDPELVLLLKKCGLLGIVRSAQTDVRTKFGLVTAQLMTEWSLLEASEAVQL